MPFSQFLNVSAGEEKDEDDESGEEDDDENEKLECDDFSQSS